MRRKHERLEGELFPFKQEFRIFLFFSSGFDYFLSLSFIIQTQDLTPFYTYPRDALRCSFLPCHPRKELLLVSVVAITCRPSGFAVLD
jgi:hypothetical protein